jgi:hypothetical protein
MAVKVSFMVMMMVLDGGWIARVWWSDNFFWKAFETFFYTGFARSLYEIHIAM